MASEIVNNDEVAVLPNDQQDALLKGIVADMAKLNLLGLGKAQAALASAMLKPIREAQKLLDKAADKPKRLSPHLRKFREWKEYVHEDAKKHGWPQFTSTKKNTKTGVTDTTTYDASIVVEDAHVFPTQDSKGKYKSLTPVQASSLAKHYWSEAAKAGARQDLWEAFSLIYNPDAPADDEKSSSADASEKKSGSQKKSGDAAAKKAQADIDKQMKAAKKEADRKQKLEDKQRKLREEAEAIQRALENPQTPEQRAADIAAKKAAREAAKKAKEAPVAAVAAASEPASPIVVVEKPKAMAMKRAPIVAYVDTFVPNPEGLATEWAFKGVSYFRSPLNALYDIDAQVYVGVFDPKTATINADVANPDPEQE